MVKLTINGEQKSFDAPADIPLLSVLRDVLGMTGTNFGCGIAQCGACALWQQGIEPRCTGRGGVEEANVTMINRWRPPETLSTRKSWIGSSKYNGEFSG
jgi:isoquinoline 1-oxidoreductase subunit alpha